jgi:hypothetical protein
MRLAVLAVCGGHQSDGGVEMGSTSGAVEIRGYHASAKGRLSVYRPSGASTRECADRLRVEMKA